MKPRLRPDQTPVWPLRPSDIRLPDVAAAEQRKQCAILERRVEASRS